MRVLFVTSSAPYGKGETFVMTEAEAIARLNHEIIVLPTLRRSRFSQVDLCHDNISILNWPLFRFAFAVVAVRLFFSSPMTLFQLLHLSFDKSILSTFKNFLVIPKAIYSANYLKRHPVDHIHAHWLTTPSTLAMLVSHLTGVPWSATAHRGDIVADNALTAKLKTAKFVRFISKSGIKLASERVDLSLGNVKLLHVGVDIDGLRVNSRVLTRRDRDFFHIACPANLIPVKGHSTLFNAIDKMQFKNKIKLFLFGDGELRRQLEKHARELGLSDTVIFCGHVGHSELLGWYRNLKVDLVVLPSLDLGGGVHEGIPVSLIEAMAFNIPVISTRTGGIPELLEDGDQRFGGIVDPGNVDELSEALDAIVRSPENADSLKAAAKYRVVNEFNQAVIASVLISWM